MKVIGIFIPQTKSYKEQIHIVGVLPKLLF